MDAGTTRTTDSAPTRSGAYPEQKRPTMLSLGEPAKQMEYSDPLLTSTPSIHRGAQATAYPMSPMTPDLDVDESPGSSQSSSASSTFTFNLLHPTSPHPDRELSFTACPCSPLNESTVYTLPPRKRLAGTSFPMHRLVLSDQSDLSIAFGTPLLEDPPREGMQSPIDDRKCFHVQFLQEDLPFPKTPDY